MRTESPKTSYQIEFRPQRHELEVILTLEGLSDLEPVRLATPHWIPGAYGFMKYGRDVFNVKAIDPGTGTALTLRREGWSGYVVEALSQSIEVTFTVYAFDPAWGELAGFVDEHQALFLATRCLYAPDHPGPCRVQYRVPQGWEIHHPLGSTQVDALTFEHPSHLAFLDCPVVLGAFHRSTRLCQGVPFHFVFLDQALGFDTQMDSFLDALMRLAVTCSDVFGPFPFQDFTFIFSFDPRSHWGLEHANATTIGLSQDCFIDPKALADGLRVCVHELFHAWNGCRLKPAPLGAPDLLQGGFPDALWITEGFTRYYEFLLCVRSGAISPEAFFSNIVNYYRQFSSQPASERVSVVDASHATFLNHNRYPGCGNSTIDYYDKGMLIAFDLDVALRTADDTSNLDGEVRALYQAFCGVGAGLTHAQARDFLIGRTPSLGSLLIRETETPSKLGVASALQALGFEVGMEPCPTLGLVLVNNAGPALADVMDTSPAGAAGLAPGDEIQRLDGFPFSLKALKWLIAHRPTFRMEVLRGHRQLTFDLSPGERKSISSLTWRGSSTQLERIQRWLQREDFVLNNGDQILLDAFDNFHGIHTVL